MIDTPAIGTPVVFRTDSPQWAKCQGLVYVVEIAPDGAGFSLDQHGERYVWLCRIEDTKLAPSRRRRRSGYLRNLDLAATSERLPMPWETR